MWAIERALHETEAVRDSLSWLDDLEEAAALVAPGGPEYLDFDEFANLVAMMREASAREFGVQVEGAFQEGLPGRNPQQSGRDVASGSGVAPCDILRRNGPAVMKGLDDHIAPLPSANAAA